MTIRKLDDLLVAELQETYAAEQLIASFSSGVPTADDGSEGYLARTQSRIQRLEQMLGCLGRMPEPGQRTPLQDLLAELNVLPGDDGAARVDAPTSLSAMETARHYLLPRYATLALWADELRRPDIAQLAAAILQEEKASPEPRPAAQDNSKGISLGERLTAMFDRKR